MFRHFSATVTLLTYLNAIKMIHVFQSYSKHVCECDYFETQCKTKNSAIIAMKISLVSTGQMLFKLLTDTVKANMHL